MNKPATIIPQQSSGGDVYTLIQGLSGAERAIIRKTWTKLAVKKQPLHVQLFECIAEDGIRNDAMAQKALGLTGGAQFSNLKQHLIGEVLDSLVYTSRESSATAQLHFGLMQVQLLIERSHFGLARRLCKKLYATAEEAGLYGFVLALLHQKGRLIEQHSFRQYAAEADEIAKRVGFHTAHQRTSQSIQRHTERLAILRAADQLQVSPEHREAIAGLLHELEDLGIMSQATPHLRLRYLAAMATAHYTLQDFNVCTSVCEEGLELLESKPLLAGFNPENFLSIANIAFYNEFAKGTISRVSSWLSRFDSLAIIADTNDYFHKRWAIIRFHTTLKIAHKTGDFEGVEQIVDRSGRAILSYAAQVLPPADALSVSTSIVISQFVLERYNEAEALMLEVKEHNRSLERQDVFYFTLVFHLVILYELKDWYRLDAATEAAYHILYNRKKLRPFEKELMRFLKALPARRGRDETGEFIRAFLERLEVYRTDPVQRLYFLYFNYYDWLQSKLEGISYREYRKRLLHKPESAQV